LYENTATYRSSSVVPIALSQDVFFWAMFYELMMSICQYSLDRLHSSSFINSLARHNVLAINENVHQPVYVNTNCITPRQDGLKFDLLFITVSHTSTQRHLEQNLSKGKTFQKYKKPFRNFLPAKAFHSTPSY
jgi:hypothetical protein